MKIFTKEQIKDCDQFTISNDQISSIKLMERAAQSCVSWLSEHCKNHKKFVVFCGKGNNGGDGFAIARLLHAEGFEVDVFVSSPKSTFSDDAQVNFERLEGVSGISIEKFSEVFQYQFDHDTVVIDALFGIGLSRVSEGEYKELIDYLNVVNAVKISIDVPSGLFADKISDDTSSIFKADYTLSFQFWKKSFMHPESGKFTGKVEILDIDLNKDYIYITETDDFAINDELVKSIFKPRQEFSHKGTYGRVNIVAGSYGKMGAAVLATKAALKTGAGLTFSMTPGCGYDILQTSCPEAMFIKTGDQFTNTWEINENSVYGIGPGMGTNSETQKALLKFLKEYEGALVLDADALNMISENKKNLNLISKNTIITPHPKEFERLFGETKDSFERLELARQKAKEYQIYIVLKDHHTQVVSPEGKVYYNTTGNAGLAKGGSGDVLTGVLASLLAQGYSEEEAAVLGVWIHGKAADYAAEKYSKESMLPSDLINEFGNVFEKLNKKTAVKL
ncbi:bifunctional ADP-dependent NAD(P)H-hydrate dehydratase/NAD(P)H-hydrate epimerase [Chryseobacterium sp. T16E-39]|uniref:NAD(P)H-hydrate dehydratase n=1 Tax=Chryseobacterium sp. T16E-39 TaxID=2015076 RepID=UPI000B5B16AC|nr:NAD(P)H-hydrate dehydratase [Chryseobacterium sp. T16E-39]ASK32614.1 bifunctional ADP-dependent NAD(P)H-hydrate dehydratase/NAD(P)H-hydrate epimerase [Chryseobacterium sp. T16E-39]